MVTFQRGKPTVDVSGVIGARQGVRQVVASPVARSYPAPGHRSQASIEKRVPDAMLSVRPTFAKRGQRLKWSPIRAVDKVLSRRRRLAQSRHAKRIAPML